MALTRKEEVELARLLGKMEWPLPKSVFHALMSKVVSVANEMVVLDDRSRVFTIYRRDFEYIGNHLPGTIVQDNDKSIRAALRRLVREELPGIRIASIQNIGWLEVAKGDGPEMNRTRHQIALIWIARLKYPYVGAGTFSPINSPPSDTLGHHKMILKKVRRHLRTGAPIIGA